MRNMTRLKASAVHRTVDSEVAAAGQKRDRGGAIFDAELAENAEKMRLHSRKADAEPLADLLVGPAAAKLRRDLGFARGEAVTRERGLRAAGGKTAALQVEFDIGPQRLGVS